MKETFQNSSPVAIDSGQPSELQSTIEVDGVDGRIVHVSVAFDVDHTYTQDLEIRLDGPSGQSVVLVAGEGGSGDHFRDTTFDDSSGASIVGESAPFTGTFHPEESLAAFEEQNPNGAWTLRVSDQAWFDGGTLNRWSLTLTTDAQDAPRFAIEVRFGSGLTDAQREVFQLAADRWAEVIVGPLTPVQTDIGIVENLVIDAEGEFIDGPGAVLGQAGPTALRSSSLLPARGRMAFDSADLARMEADGRLLRVILHEMGHVLGVGTIWQRKGLLLGAGTNNPRFTGQAARDEYAILTGAISEDSIPVANTGGPGTADGHWREAVFGSELMTGFLSAGSNPLSRMSIASLADLGYEVDPTVADAYSLPSSLELAAMGLSDGPLDSHDRCRITVPDVSILPPEDEDV